MEDYESLLREVVEMIKIKMELLRDSGIAYLPNPQTLKPGLILDKNMDKNNLLKTLKEDKIGDCKRCTLCQARKNIVFGAGSFDASIVFVGEGPGEEEDKVGLPFVGRSGNLLTKMINAMGLSREEVYICNVVKCRPPANRDPKPEEIASCEPFLKEQLSIIRPKVIVGLGRHACQTLLNTKATMSEIRGKWHEYEGVRFMPTFHPAYLLRNPPAKKEAWEDLKAVMMELNTA